MPSKEELKSKKNFHLDTPMDSAGYYLRGSAHLDWGVKNRLARIFNPDSGNTVILAFHHWYRIYPTNNLKQQNQNIRHLLPQVD
jgi:putative autoinducer-2 (AI-2) aldolase